MTLLTINLFSIYGFELVVDLNQDMKPVLYEVSFLGLCFTDYVFQVHNLNFELQSSV